MWMSLVFLWFVPVAAALLMLARAAEGYHSHNWTLLLGDNEEPKKLRLSPWMALKFALLAIVFFFVGVLQSLVFANFGVAGTVVVPLITGISAVLLMAHWVRSGAHECRLRQDSLGTGTRLRRNAAMLSRAYRRLRRAILP